MLGVLPSWEWIAWGQEEGVGGGDQSEAEGSWFMELWEAHKATGCSLLGLPEASQQ